MTLLHSKILLIFVLLVVIVSLSYAIPVENGEEVEWGTANGTFDEGTKDDDDVIEENLDLLNEELLNSLDKAISVAQAALKAEGERQEQEKAKKGDDKKPKSRSTKQFPKCICFQKIRTSYITDNPCGKAALCFYEIFNYRRRRADALGETFEKEEQKGCSMYMIQKYACMIGYPKPQYPHPNCERDYQFCMGYLAKILYDDCEPIRKARGLKKPQEINPKIRIESLNYNLNYDPETHFEPRPNSAKPTHNNFYELSCPVIYRFPYFTIDLILKDIDPNSKYDYDETKGLKQVAEMLPKYVRLGVDRERMVNFEALGVDESELNWCNIPRNYVCVQEDLDPKGDKCKYESLETYRKKCEPEEESLKSKPTTIEVLAP